LSAAPQVFIEKGVLGKPWHEDAQKSVFEALVEPWLGNQMIIVGPVRLEDEAG
jgi:hypothetical protein